MIAANLQHVQTLDQELILAPATTDIQEMVKHVKVRKNILMETGPRGSFRKKSKSVVFL